MKSHLYMVFCFVSGYPMYHVVRTCAPRWGAFLNFQKWYILRVIRDSLTELQQSRSFEIFICISLLVSINLRVFHKWVCVFESLFSTFHSCHVYWRQVPCMLIPTFERIYIFFHAASYFLTERWTPVVHLQFREWNQVMRKTALLAKASYKWDNRELTK